MNRPKLSIGIPTYNQGDTIEETILSVLNQTEPVYEVVVSNNHCTDQTERVLEKYRDRIKIITPPQFLSMGENWNYLIQHLTGDWAFLISSDDVMLPNYAKTFYDNVRDDTVLMVYGRHIIDGEGKVTVRDKRVRSLRRLEGFPQNFHDELSCPKMSFGAYTFRLDVVRKIGGFDSRVVLDGDWAMWLRLAPHGKFQNIPTTVCGYRVTFRPGFNEARLEQETKDKICIMTEIIPEIINKYGLKPWLYRKSLVSVARKDYLHHKEMNDPKAETIPARYGVAMDEVRRFGKWDKFLIKLNETILKL